MKRASLRPVAPSNACRAPLSGNRVLAAIERRFGHIPHCRFQWVMLFISLSWWESRRWSSHP